MSVVFNESDASENSCLLVLSSIFFFFSQGSFTVNPRDHCGCMKIPVDQQFVKSSDLQPTCFQHP